MSIITWVENGKKQFALFDSKYFDRVDVDFPIYESRHASFRSVVAFSEEEVVMVSGDRKRFRRLQPSEQKKASGRSRTRGQKQKMAG